MRAATETINVGLNDEPESGGYSVIYFLEAVGVGSIKIGFTDRTDVESRIAEIQTGCPVPVRLLKSMPGTLEDEKNLHRRFASSRLNGEWFKPVPELIQHIKPCEALTCDGVEVAERSVSIRVLTVGRKQFSKSLLAQMPLMPEEQAMNWPKAVRAWRAAGETCDFDLTQFRTGECWGWVRDGGERYLIIEDKGILWRFNDGRNLRAERAFPKPSKPMTAAEDDARKENIVDMETLLIIRYQSQGWRPEDQLFFGV